MALCTALYGNSAYGSSAYGSPAYGGSAYDNSAYSSTYGSSVYGNSTHGGFVKEALYMMTLCTALYIEALLENKPATISRDETCGRNLLAGI
jgi:hypothetical protein